MEPTVRVEAVGALGPVPASEEQGVAAAVAMSVQERGKANRQRKQRPALRGIVSDPEREMK